MKAAGGMDLQRIAVLDQDQTARSSLGDGLRAAGFTVVEAADRTELFDSLESQSCDAVAVELADGAPDGYVLARALRSRWNLPLLVIGTAHPVDRVTGLENGADDYIVKPFDMREVVLRLNRLLDRYTRTHEGDGSFVFDHSAYDTRTGVVTHLDGTTVELTGIERQIFELFARRPRRVLSRDEISRSVHGRDWSPYDRTIDGHIARLRRKLETPDEKLSLIRSVRGVGYVFDGEIRTSPQPA